MKLLPILLVPALAVVVAASPPIENAAAETEFAGNAFYRVSVDADLGGGDAGTFAISTGPDHPAGAGLSILYPGEDESQGPGSYITVRSYTTGTDYVQSSVQPASGNLVVALKEYAEVSVIGQTGYRTTYDLPGPPDSAEVLRIVSDVNVNGESYSDSAIEITVTVTNLDVVPISIGVRYALDLQVAGDDGPVLTPVGPSATAVVTESSFLSPAFEGVRAEDNSTAGSQLAVFATVGAGYVGVEPPNTAPDLLQYAYWPDAELAAFDYDTSDRDIATPLGLDDGALMFYFGATAEDAMLLEPGESTTVSLSMFATSPVTGPELCDNATDDDGDRLTDEEDSDCQASSTPTSSPTPPTPATTPSALPPTGGGAAQPHLAGILALALGLVGVVGTLAIYVYRRATLSRLT